MRQAAARRTTPPRRCRGTTPMRAAADRRPGNRAAAFTRADRCGGNGGRARSAPRSRWCRRAAATSSGVCAGPISSSQRPGLHRRMVGDVEGRQVHGDAAYQRDRGAVKERLAAAGQAAVPAVGIADADGGDARRAGGAPGGVVADAVARRRRRAPPARGAVSRTGRRIGFGRPGVGLMPYSAAPGRARSEPHSAPRKMPDELAKLRGAGGSPARAAAKRSRCRWLSGSSGSSDATRCVIT